VRDYSGYGFLVLWNKIIEVKGHISKWVKITHVYRCYQLRIKVRSYRCFVLWIPSHKGLGS
jgi:hypothetical protein